MKGSDVVLILILSLTLGTINAGAQEGETSALIADFDNAQPVNNLGKEIEIWLREDGSDTTQSCQMTFVQDDALGNSSGHSVRLDYDVDSPNPAYNGIRTDLNHFNAAGYKALNFYIKGDPEKGFTKKLKIELMGPNKRPSPYMIDGITSEWQRFSIPLSEFWGIQDWTSLEKFVVVFADINNDPKSGSVYLDHVHFSA